MGRRPRRGGPESSGDAKKGDAVHVHVAYHCCGRDTGTPSRAREAPGWQGLGVEEFRVQGDGQGLVSLSCWWEGAAGGHCRGPGGGASLQGRQGGTVTAVRGCESVSLQEGAATRAQEDGMAGKGQSLPTLLQHARMCCRGAVLSLVRSLPASPPVPGALHRCVPPRSALRRVAALVAAVQAGAATAVAWARRSRRPSYATGRSSACCR